MLRAGVSSRSHPRSITKDSWNEILPVPGQISSHLEDTTWAGMQRYERFRKVGEALAGLSSIFLIANHGTGRVKSDLTGDRRRRCDSDLCNRFRDP